VLVLVGLIAVVWYRAVAYRQISRDWFGEQPSSDGAIHLALPGRPDEYAFGCGPIMRNGTTMVPLQVLMSMGIVARYDATRQIITATVKQAPYTFRIGERQYQAGSRQALLPEPPRLVTVTGDSPGITPLQVPYLPIQPLAQCAGWTVKLDGARLHYEKSFENLSRIRTQAEIGRLHLADPAPQSDGYLKVTPSFGSHDFRDAFYVAHVGFRIENVGRTPLPTGHYALFVERVSGIIDDQWCLRQSEPPAVCWVKPGRRLRSDTLYLNGIGGMFAIPFNDPVVRVIYHDGVRCFSWDVHGGDDAHR
jgi:hypothetical protein